MRVGLLVVLCAGCSSIVGIEDVSVGADATPTIDAATTTDAFVTARRWGVPEQITELDNGASQVGPTMSADMLRVCFTAMGATSFDIFCAERADSQAPFGTPTLASISDDSSDGNAAFAPDGLYFASDRLGDRDIWRATVGANGFGAPELVAEISTPGSESGPALSRDGLVMYFSKFNPGTTTDLYRVTRTAVSEPWGVPALLAALNTDTTDSEPAPNSDDSFLVFCSDRDGGSKLWGAQRQGNSFAAPQPIDMGSYPGLGQCSPEILADESLMFSATDVFVAPPLFD